MRLAPVLPALMLMLLPHLPALAHTACADAPLRLNEIMAGPARDWDGSGVFSSRDDEWIELVNVGPTPLDLAGWLLTDGDRIPRLALGGTLGPGEHHAFFGSESYAWEKAHGFPAFGFSLANSGDQVMLWEVVGPDTVLVESYAYLAHEAAADRAAGRSPDGDGSWALFDGLNLYTGTLTPAGNGCAPTPGTGNACVSTPARPMTWGRVKALYR